MFLSRSSLQVVHPPMKSIVEIVGDRIDQILTSALIHHAPAHVRAEVVRVGLSQEDPVQRRIGVYIHVDDPDDLSEDPGWSDAHLSPREATMMALSSIGGGVRFSRKFVVEIKAYFVNTRESRQQAIRQANWITDAAHQALTDAQALGLTDSFGETAIHMFVYKVDRQESGGPPNSHIWRSRLYIRVHTEIPSE